MATSSLGIMTMIIVFCSVPTSVIICMRLHFDQSRQITLQFDLSRRRRQGRQLVSTPHKALCQKKLPKPTTYRKVNPADHPVLILGLTSDTVPLTDLDNSADLNLAQRIATMRHVGQVADLR